MLQRGRLVRSLFFVIFVALFAAQATRSLQAGQSFDWPIETGPLDITRPFEPQTFFDYGDMTSLTSEGLLFRVRPSEPSLVDHEWKGYPPFVPAPATPAQDSVSLYAGTPLTAYLPQLAYMPQIAVLSVHSSRLGNEFFVDATLDRGTGWQQTIVGPQEYLLPLGSLDAGDYKISFRLVDSNDFASPASFTTTGYLRFTVKAVPEPSGLLLACLGGSLVVAVARSRVLPKSRTVRQFGRRNRQ